MNKKHEKLGEICIALPSTLAKNPQAGVLFDKRNIYAGVPTKRSFNKGAIEVVKGDVYYLDSKGQKCIPFVEGVKQYCNFGVQARYDTKLKENERTPEKAEGYQIQMAQTSLATMKTPTPDEAYLTEVLNSFRQAIDYIATNERAAVASVIPASALSFFEMAEMKNKESKRKGEPFEPISAVKPIFEYGKKKDPKDQNKKIVNTDYPKSTYLRLLTQGKGLGITFETKFYNGDENEREESPKLYIDKKCSVKPLYKVDGSFWGAHGTSPYGASLQLRLGQALAYAQASGFGGPSTKMLVAPKEEDPTSTTNNNTGGGTGATALTKLDKARAEGSKLKKEEERQSDSDSESKPTPKKKVKKVKKEKKHLKKEKPKKPKSSDSEDD
jgi:hypothetical protein